MDVSRSWKTIRPGYAQCGPFEMFRVGGKYAHHPWEIWHAPSGQLLVTVVHGVEGVRWWIKQNWRRLRDEGLEDVR